MTDTKTPDGDEVPIEVKEIILDQELKTYFNTRYRLEVLHRVNKRIGSDAAVLDNLTKELAQIEAMIDALKEEKKGLRK